MTSTYPSTIGSIPNPQSTDRLNSPSHSAIEQGQNSEITAVETFLGLEGSASTAGTIVYDVRSPGSNGGGHVQTANKGGTGQTTYNMGDILVAQSSSVLAKLSSSGNPTGYALVIDPTQATGLKWGVPGNSPTVRIFSVQGNPSSTFTWAKPSNLSYIRVRVQGPGGGGPSILAGTSGSSGASAGGYSEKVIPASVLNATEEVRVGGPGQISSSLSGISSFGLANSSASMLANPGNQGGIAGAPTAGGTAFGGTINISGGPGASDPSFSTNIVGGDGGDSMLGVGGRGTITTKTPQAPTGYGSAGPGGAHDGSGTATPFAGAPGIVIVEEY